MTAVIITVGLFWLYCGTMGLLARDERAFLHHYLFHAGSAVLFVVLVCASGTALVRAGPGFGALMTIPAFVIVIIVGIFLGIRYWALLVGEYVDRFHAAATGIDRMKVESTYDRAAKAEKDGDLEEAMRRYEQAGAENPRDPEPHRRLADLHLKRGAIDPAVSNLRAALERVEAPEERATLAFRISDVLAREGRPAEARRALEDAVRDLAGTRFEGYARERLNSLPSA